MTASAPWSSNLGAIAVNAADQVFVATAAECADEAGAGVFRSTDGGRSWTPANNGLTNNSARSLAIASSGAIFAGTRDGVFCSTDGGDTWTQTELRGVDISTLTSGPGVLFAADACSCTGAYRSMDGGNSWQQINAGLAGCVNGLAVDNAGYVFAATANQGLYRSADHGSTWTPTNTGLTTLDLKSVAVNDSGDVFVGSVSHGVFRSTDRGMSWKPAGLPGIGVNAFAIGSGGEIFAGANTAIYRSIDNGDSWSSVRVALSEHAEVSSLAFDSRGTAFAAAGRRVLRAASMTATLSVPAALDSAASASGSGSSLSWSHTVNASTSGLLVVGVSSHDGSKKVRGITYGSAVLSRAGSLGNSSHNRVEIWSLLAPPAGTAKVTVTLQASEDIVGESLSFTGVDQTRPLGTFASAKGNNSAPSLNIPTVPGQLVVDTMVADGGAGSATAGAGQTAKWNNSTGATDADIRAAGSLEPATSSSVTMSWTLTTAKYWTLGAVLINPANSADDSTGCQSCALGYPIDDPANPRTSSVFNESGVLRAFDPPQGCLTTENGGMVKLWYNDEHALTLGVRRVVVKERRCVGGTNIGSLCTSNSGCPGSTCASAVTTTTDYPVSPLLSSPDNTTNPDVGTTALTGDQAGTDTNTCGIPDCGRPMWPALFLTDITDDPDSRAGDWQYGGTPIAPSAIYGTWKAAVKTIDKTTNPWTITVTADSDPSKNNWSLGPGAHAPGAGLSNEGYGAEVVWNVSDLPLVQGHLYRLQFMVHDGDQNKLGGDSGEACVNGVPAPIPPTQVAPGNPPKTATPTPTATPTATATPTPTYTPTATPTYTPTDVPTDTPTSTPTRTPTATPTNVPTNTPTRTPTIQPTPKPTLPWIRLAPNEK